MSQVIIENIPALEAMKKYPKALFYKGNLELLNRPKVSIVGSRNTSLYTQDFCKGILVCVEAARKIAEKEFSNYEIRAPGIDTEAKTLSGGNLSKLVLATEFSWKSKFLIDQLVTQGLDVATTEYIRKKLFEAKKEGKAVLLFSKDLDEILMMSDRIAPIYEGELSEPVPSDKTSKMEIGAAIIGK